MGVNFRNKKKGIGPVIASSLLIVVAVVAIIGFQTWFNSYSSTMFSDVESQSQSSVSQTKIDQLLGDTLYFRNGFSENLTITDVKIGGNSCGISMTSNSSSLTQISLNSNCTTNLTSSKIEAVVYTNKGPYSTYFYNRNVTASASLSSNSSEEVVNLTLRNNVVNQSLRFNDDDSAYLSLVPGSAGNRTTWTCSVWVKFTIADNPSYDVICPTIYASGSDFGIVALYQDNIYFSFYNGGYQARLVSNHQFRDVSSWKHFLFEVDTRESTSSDRVKIYVDGERVTSFSTETYPSQYTILNRVNNVGESHYIGRLSAGYSDFYLSNVQFVDGKALGPEYFGELNDVGGWIPKSFNDTYGSNGFYLTFQNSSNFGLDYSGNGNNFTAYNLDSTDKMFDSPENNFPIFDPEWRVSGTYANVGNLVGTYSDGNLQVYGSNSGTGGVYNSNMKIPSYGKWYSEAKILNKGSHNINLGLQDLSQGYPAIQSVSYATDGGGLIGASSYTTGDVIGIAVNMDNFSVQYYKNGVLAGSPVTIVVNQSSDFFFRFSHSSVSANDRTQWNFGQGGISGTTYNESANGYFVYTPPENFKAINTYNVNQNLSISNPTNYFDTILYTGTGSAQNITGLSFSPDLVWIKNRDTTDEYKLLDSLRGVTYEISSDSDVVQSTDVNGLTSFNSGGFTLGTGANGYNDNTEDFVSWNWKEDEDTFDIVTYTGDGTGGRAIAHSLTSAPEFVIIKNLVGTDTGGESWAVWHKSLGSGSWLQLDSNAAVVTSSAYFNSQAPNSTHFIVGSHSDVNYNGDSFVAYLFNEVEGFSKFGTYKGNGNANGAKVFTGFKPKFVLFKRTDSTESWVIQDTERSPYNVMDAMLLLDNPISEVSGGYNVDFLSNGFKLRNNGAFFGNANNADYIYIAFAEKSLN